MREVTLEDTVIKACNAASILNNPMLKAAFQAVRDQLELKALAVSATDTECVKDIIRCKQLLAGVERVIFRLIQDGKVAQKELDSLAPRRKIFSRL